MSIVRILPHHMICLIVSLAYCSGTGTKSRPNKKKQETKKLRRFISRRRYEHSMIVNLETKTPCHRVGRTHTPHSSATCLAFPLPHTGSPYRLTVRLANDRLGLLLGWLIAGLAYRSGSGTGCPGRGGRRRGRRTNSPHTLLPDNVTSSRIIVIECPAPSPAVCDQWDTSNTTKTRPSWGGQRYKSSRS